MNTESKFEKLYNDLVEGIEQMHTRNVKKTRSALKCLLIVPTIFLIFLFLTDTSKTVFLVLWIASMFVISCVLVIVEYQDYLLRKMFSQIDDNDSDSTRGTDSQGEAAKLAEQIKLKSGSPEKQEAEATAN